MNGIDFLVDTNILIGIKEGKPNVEPLVGYQLAVSIISEIELMGWNKISRQERKIYSDMLKKCQVIELTTEIKDTAIKIKQHHPVKTPDAIIAATSLVFGYPLVTGDKAFGKISKLDLILI